MILNGHDDVITDLPATNRSDTSESHPPHEQGNGRVELNHSLLPKLVRLSMAKRVDTTHLLIIEKTGAYIEYFYEHGMIEITNPDEVEQGMPPVIVV